MNEGFDFTISENSNFEMTPYGPQLNISVPNKQIKGKILINKTGEIYIGQTTSLDKRFQDHVKSALGVGTLATSTLHRLMEKDGPENFSFEIIEKVEKDKLKEKEAFYIDFYDSKNYGMNSISGVKNETK